MANATVCDIYTNPRFMTFRRKLEDKGHILKMLWSCKSGLSDPSTGKPHKYDDVACFVVTGGKRPKVSTLIVTNYGFRDGFGLWLDSGANGYDEDVKAIAHDEFTVSLSDEA